MSDSISPAKKIIYIIYFFLFTFSLFAVVFNILWGIGVSANTLDTIVVALILYGILCGIVVLILNIVLRFKIKNNLSSNENLLGKMLKINLLLISLAGVFVIAILAYFNYKYWGTDNYDSNYARELVLVIYVQCANVICMGLFTSISLFTLLKSKLSEKVLFYNSFWFTFMVIVYPIMVSKLV